MFIKKKEKGYGWYAKVSTTDMSNNTLTGYINFLFKKGFEPQQLNQYGAYEGELIFRTRYGGERKVFPIVKSYRDQTYIDFMLLEENPPVQNKGYENTNRNGVPELDNDTKIEMDNLPFY